MGILALFLIQITGFYLIKDHAVALSVLIIAANFTGFIEGFVRGKLCKK